MSGLIAYTSVLLLARKRLERIEKLLRGKALAGTTVNEIERQVLFLARQALQALSSAPQPTTRFDPDTFAPWLATGVSQFAMMGSLGPEITRFSARYVPRQAWLVDTLRTGNPDPTRSQVLARSTDFLLAQCDRLVNAISAQAPGAARDALLAKARAFVLGQACHVAASAVAAPFVDAAAFELGTLLPKRDRATPDAVRGAIEEAVSRGVYHRNDPRGKDWNGFLPVPDQVPTLLFDAYAGAAADIYGAGARVPGSKAYNDALAEAGPPVLSADLVRDGYSTYRLLAERNYTWTYGDWLLATLFMFAWPALMFPFSALLPQGRHLRREDNDPFFAGKPPDEQRDGERALFEVMTFPLAANGLVPLAITAWLMTHDYHGRGKQTVFGLVNGIVVLVAAIVFFATLHTGMPDWARWLFLFAIPVALEIAHIVYVLATGGDDPRRWQLAMASISHLVVALFFVVCFVAFLHFGAEEQVEKGLDSGKFWGYAVLWLVITAVLWLVMSALLTLVETGIPVPRRNDFIGARRQFLRLIDDAQLGAAAVPAPPSTLAQRLFPAAGMPVLKLTWTGPGNLFIRSRRHTLEFAFAADGSGAVQQVLAPIAPMTAKEYAALLKKAVTDNAGNFSGQLTVEPFLADEPLDPQLGGGMVFADHGDDESTVEGHDTEALKFKAVPAAGDPYVLKLAPLAAIAVRAGRAGSLLALPGAVAVVGPGNLTPVVGPNVTALVGDANTRFLETFVAGDVIETPAGAPTQARVVVAVQDDQHLTVNTAAAPFAAAQTYARRVRDREEDLVGVGTVANNNVTFRQLDGTGTNFDQVFAPGDLITATPPGGGPAETRTVVSVASATTLMLELPFSVAIPTSPIVAPVVGAAFGRPGRRTQEAFAVSPADPSALFAGQSVVDRAADVATLLCLGVQSHLLLGNERAAVAAGALDQRHGAIGKAWQVLRNWNLDHRRVNEWRMLVGGSAVSEKHGHADHADVLQPRMPAALLTPAAAGEPLSNRLGWSPLFAQWLDMAARPATDTVADTSVAPGAPSNLALSRAVAFLFDLPSPV
ncbi:hypothetical protein [Variovorax rhizosphaerae]|uniref:Uncharacterized protein n=1 Tax=Variovorax rhizosphaerae TaxID=1836200 RepID=A0ABU8WPR7_9BURK